MVMLRTGGSEKSFRYLCRSPSPGQREGYLGGTCGACSSGTEKIGEAEVAAPGGVGAVFSFVDGRYGFSLWLVGKEMFLAEES